MVLAIANVLRVHSQADVDGMAKGLQTFLTIMVSLVLLLVWWLFLSGLRWRVRLAAVAVVVLCAVGLKLLLRIDGSYGGNGSPRVVWKWTPKRSGNVGS